MQVKHPSHRINFLKKILKDHIKSGKKNVLELERIGAVLARFLSVRHELEYLGRGDLN